MKRQFALAATTMLFLSVGMAITPGVRASVVDYETYVQGLSGVTLQYDFNGSSSATQLSSKAATAGSGLSMSGSPTLNASGFDSTSNAVSTTMSSTGLYTSSAITLPASGATVEGIYKAGADVGSTQYFISAFNGSYRSYFSIVDGGYWKACAGSSYSPLSCEAATAGDWYYMATTMSYDSGTGKTTVNVYMADLTAGETTLNHYSTTFTGTFSFAWKYGVGGNYYNSLVQTPTGSIDSATFYNTAESSTLFQNNLAKIYAVPEPGTLALAVAALVGLFAYAWRKRR